MWSKYFGGPEHYFLVSQTGEIVQCAKGLKVVTDYSFENCSRLDYLLIPGGQGTRREVENQALLILKSEFITKRGQERKCHDIF